MAANTKRLSITIPEELHSELTRMSEENLRTLQNEIVFGLRQYALGTRKVSADLVQNGASLVQSSASLVQFGASLVQPEHIKRVTTAYTEAFGSTPQASSVQTWLRFGTLENVLDAIAEAKLRNNRNGGYITTIVKSFASGKFAPTRPNAPNAERATPSKPWGNDGGWVMRPPTAEELAADEEAKRFLIEQGLYNANMAERLRKLEEESDE